jgi:hypothetical protein
MAYARIPPPPYPQPGQEPRSPWVQSGVRPRYAAPVETEALGACSFIVASALGIDRPGDSAPGVASVVGCSWLRAAAWLRSRGAVVGHAVSKLRLFGAQAAEYELAARTPLTRSRALIRFGRLEAHSIARWMDADRIAIIHVSAPWGNAPELRPMVVVGAGQESLSLFDPSRGGVVDEVGFDPIDAARRDPRAAFEVLLARARA